MASGEDLNSFRQFIVCLANEITNNELKTAKWLVKDKLGARNYENIKDTLDFFEKLHEGNHFHEGDTRLLSQILSAIERRDLIEDLNKYHSEHAVISSRMCPTVSDGPYISMNERLDGGRQVKEKCIVPDMVNAHPVVGKSQLANEAHQEIPDPRFKQLLTDISLWYDKRKYINMLKVLYTDIIPEADLYNTSRTIEFMHILMNHGKLCKSDLSILYDTIKATQQFGLVEKIQDIIPSCLDLRSSYVISRITIHRQKLMELGWVLNQSDVVTVDGLYNAPLKKYPDSWSLIRDLEHRLEISAKNLHMFIEKLEKNKLYAAANVLK